MKILTLTKRGIDKIISCYGNDFDGIVKLLFEQVPSIKNAQGYARGELWCIPLGDGKHFTCKESSKNLAIVSAGSDPIDYSCGAQNFGKFVVSADPPRLEYLLKKCKNVDKRLL